MLPQNVYLQVVDYHEGGIRRNCVLEAAEVLMAGMETETPYLLWNIRENHPHVCRLMHIKANTPVYDSLTRPYNRYDILYNACCAIRRAGLLSYERPYWTLHPS